MREIVATITSKGRITLPAAIRRHLGVQIRDKVALLIEDDGSVRVPLLVYPTIESLRGAAGSLASPLSWDEVIEIARSDYLAEEYGADE